MPPKQRFRSGGVGRLSYRPAPDDGPLPRTLAFLRRQLHDWRSDPNRSDAKSENSLTYSLCLFLDRQSRSEPGLPMVQFVHQSPQTGRCNVDIAVHGTAEMTLVGCRAYSAASPFLVIECKRLPADRAAREREYVTGSHSGGGPAGGIQRFKLGLHGRGVEVAAIVGYIQEETPQHWHVEINRWIAELADRNSHDDCEWSLDDRLQPIDIADVSACHSSHVRIGDCVTSSVLIHHLWICMN